MSLSAAGPDNMGKRQLLSLHFGGEGKIAWIALMLLVTDSL